VINYAHRQGAVVVVSAGNENINMDTFGEDWYKVYCTIPNVVCVSATGPTSGGTVGPWLNVDNRAPYSNYGVEWVTVAAPGGAAGGSVTAACSRFSTQIPVCRTGTYVVGISGTSMAAPHASGVAALIVERVGKDKPGLVRNRLSQSADDLGPAGSDPVYGKGRINAARAVGL
jgi:subtilisin family serine protease